MDTRIDGVESRLEARLERALREQTNRFFFGLGAMATLVLTAQQVIERLGS